MNAQLSFADVPLARRVDPDTSKGAAQRAQRGWIPKIADLLDQRVFGLTDDEICTRLGVPVRQWPTVKAARSRMYHKRGLVEPVGERHGQTVWRLVRVASVRVVGEVL